MPLYQGQSAGDIGSLLRLIQEEKASSALQNLPGSEPGSPIRDVTQEPLKSPEAPGSSRVVSTRPEGGSFEPIAPGGQTAVPGGVVAPIQPVAPRVAAPVAPSPMGAPSASLSAPSAPSLSRVSTPSIGTRISGQPVNVSANMSGGSRPAGTQIRTSTPATPQSSRFGNIGIGGTISAAQKVAPKLGTSIADFVLSRAGKAATALLDTKQLFNFINKFSGGSRSTGA